MNVYAYTYVNCIYIYKSLFIYKCKIVSIYVCVRGSLNLCVCSCLYFYLANIHTNAYFPF